MKRKIEMITCCECGQLFTNLLPTKGLISCDCGNIICSTTEFSVHTMQNVNSKNSYKYRKFKIEDGNRFGYLFASNIQEYDAYCNRLLELEFNLGVKGNEFERDLLIALILIWDRDHNTLSIKKTSTTDLFSYYSPSLKGRNRKVSVNVDLLLGSSKQIISKQKNYSLKRNIKTDNYLEQ